MVRIDGHKESSASARWAHVLLRVARPLPQDRLSPSPERSDALRVAGSVWPDRPSVVLRLAARAHGLDEGLDERFARAPARLLDWSQRDPWSPDPDDAQTVLLASMVLLERIEYQSFSDYFHGTAMVLRDALTDPEDLATIAATVRWESLVRLWVQTPDQRLEAWRTHVKSIARDVESWDVAEYENTLDIRSRLQRDVSLISWHGEAAWREHIEPVDQAFKAISERQDVPLVLSLRGAPVGWWHYRLPVDAPPSFGGDWSWNIDPDQYVRGPHPDNRLAALVKSRFTV